jgi:hypothetical protein
VLAREYHDLTAAQSPDRAGEHSAASGPGGASGRGGASETGNLDGSGGAGHFADIAYDTVAAVLNDLVCVGALPLVLNAYFATGSSAWYADAARADALLAGWRRACDDARCAWGGGESPALAACSPARTSSSPAARSASSRHRASRCSAKTSRRATRSCWCPPAACTPTAPRLRA